MDLLFPFKVWLWIVILTTAMSFIGTWIVLAKSKSFKKTKK